MRLKHIFKCMEAHNLLKKSHDLYIKANELLEKTDLIKAFFQLGKVEVIGSLKLNLMYRLDIDLLAISEKIEKSQALEVTKILLDSGKFRSVTLADYHTFPGYDMPLGFYLELVVLDGAQEWKFDVWYLKPDEKYTHMVFDAIARFEEILVEAPEKAKTILQIKEALFDGVKYKNQVTGFDIYTAVLENGVSSVDQFIQKQALRAL